MIFFHLIEMNSHLWIYLYLESEKFKMIKTSKKRILLESIWNIMNLQIYFMSFGHLKQKLLTIWFNKFNIKKLRHRWRHHRPHSSLPFLAEMGEFNLLDSFRFCARLIANPIRTQETKENNIRFEIKNPFYLNSKNPKNIF